MSTLAELQREFQRHVLLSDEQIVERINSTPDIPATTRLQVYWEAYRLRLVEVLASNVPCLQQLLGAAAFNELAQVYLADCPSPHRSIRWFGDRLADWLRETHPAQPWLAELAHWEWTVGAAFDAGDAAPLGLHDLAAIAPEHWPELAFEFHPSARLLRLQTNAQQLAKAIGEEQPPPTPAVLEQPQAWLVWRRSFTPQYRAVEPAEAAAFDAVRQGANFAAMCDALCSWYEGDQLALQAAGMLQRWVIDELISGVRGPTR